MSISSIGTLRDIQYLSNTLCASLSPCEWWTFAASLKLTGWAPSSTAALARDPRRHAGAWAKWPGEIFEPQIKSTFSMKLLMVNISFWHHQQSHPPRALTFCMGLKIDLSWQGVQSGLRWVFILCLAEPFKRNELSFVIINASKLIPNDSMVFHDDIYIYAICCREACYTYIIYNIIYFGRWRMGGSNPYNNLPIKQNVLITLYIQPKTFRELADCGCRHKALFQLFLQRSFRFQKDWSKSKFCAFKAIYTYSPTCSLCSRLDGWFRCWVLLGCCLWLALCSFGCRFGFCPWVRPLSARRSRSCFRHDSPAGLLDSRGGFI